MDQSQDYNGDYDFHNKPHRTGSEAITDGLGTYALLKTLVVAYQAGKRGLDRGQSTEEAVKTGATAGLAWQGMLALTCVYLLMVSSVIAQVVAFYDPLSDSQFPKHNFGYMWGITLFFGVGAIIVVTAIWLIMYSRLKDHMVNSKKGRMYKVGFRIRRRVALMTPWWKLWIIATVAPMPFYMLMNYAS